MERGFKHLESARRVEPTLTRPRQFDFKQKRRTAYLQVRVTG